MNNDPATCPVLFARLVTASGLSALLARAALSRALQRAGVKDPEHLTRAEVLRSLPQLRAALAVYLSTDEVEERVHAIEVL